MIHLEVKETVGDLSGRPLHAIHTGYVLYKYIKLSRRTPVNRIKWGRVSPVGSDKITNRFFYFQMNHIIFPHM